MKTTKTNKRTIPALSIMLVLAFFSVNMVYAQNNPWNLEGRIGVAVPSAALSDVENAGLDLGLKASYFVSPYFEARVDGEVELLGGKGSAPNMQLWHYTAGLGWSWTNPEVTPWSFILNAGTGATTINTDSYSTKGSFTQTYFTINYGVKIGYDVSKQVDLFVSGMAYTMFATHSSTQYFADIPGGRSFSTVTSFPITAGMTLRF